MKRFLMAGAATSLLFAACGGGGEDPLQKQNTVVANPTTAGVAAEVIASRFAGTWNTNWGDMVCTVKGTSVHCEYTHDKGRIDATLSADGTRMEGNWAESPSYSPPNDGGRVAFTISSDGNALSGDWSYGSGASEGSWTGTRK